MKKIRTLQDVRTRLPLLYSAGTATRYDQAFNRIHELTGRHPQSMPANVIAWLEAADKIVWAGKFRGKTPGASAEAFKYWRDRIAAAIRAATKSVEDAVPADIEQAWACIDSYVAEVENSFDDAGDRLLPNMSSLSIANLKSRLGHVAPSAIDTAACNDALDRIEPDRKNQFRNSVRFLDTMISNSTRHAAIADLLPKQLIGPLKTLRDPALVWSRFSAEFLASRDKLLESALVVPGTARRSADRFAGRLGPDPTAGSRTGKRKVRKIRSPIHRSKAFMAALSWLIRHAHRNRDEAYILADIHELLHEEAIETAVDAWIQRTREEKALLAADAASSLGTYLADLRTICVRNHLSQELVDFVDDLRFDEAGDAGSGEEMSATRAAFVKLVDRSPKVVLTIVTAPRVLMGEAIRMLGRWEHLTTHESYEALHLSMGAAMVASQLSRALRTRNVNELRSEGENPELLPPIDGGSAWLDIARARTKNRRAIESPIPAHFWSVIEHWIDHGRDRYWALEHPMDPAEKHQDDGGDVAEDAPQIAESDFLFPGSVLGCPVSRATFNKVWNRCMSRLGLSGLTPHMMRHVCATIYLARHPGAYGVVADFLSDSVRTTEAFYVRGEGAAAAALFADVLMDIDPTLKLEKRRAA